MPEKGRDAGVAKDVAHYFGHRQRLKDKFLKIPEGLADYELLELLLFSAIPRADVKPLAKELLQQFPSFNELLNADETRLRSIKGVGDTVILTLRLVGTLSKRLLQQDIQNKPSIKSAKDVTTYCQQRIAFSPVESLMVLFLDNNNGIIHDEVMQRGTVDTTAIYPREILKRSLELGASSIILAHNHPSGDPTPSREDIVMTQEIIKSATPLNIAVLDHIVVGHAESISLRALGVMG
ncbi:MAG: DNA repair protein RadC [Alphaproteobacteria bacterium]|nr:DNA repair protein RadC [Alphaproteobacteria bacterium]